MAVTAVKRVGHLSPALNSPRKEGVLPRSQQMVEVTIGGPLRIRDLHEKKLWYSGDAGPTCF